MILPFALLVSLICSFQVPAQEDLAAVQEKRMVDPGDPELLLRYAELLGESGDLDGEVAYLLYALEAFELAETDDEKAKAKTLKVLGKRIKKLDVGCYGLTGKRNAYLKDLEWVLRLYSKNQKKYRNAFEVTGRILRHRPAHRLARRTLGEIMEVADSKLKTEAERLLGFKELRRSRAYRNQWAIEHGDWADAGAIENSGYAVLSNIGYSTLHKAAGSLDRISDFYREFYGVSNAAQVGKTKVFLCRTREEFQKVADRPDVTQNKGVKGFLLTSSQVYTNAEGRADVGLKFELHSYDPRDEGAPLSNLFRTLFHEASHQYMALAAGANGTPGWLNEGMATYFEGVELGEGGEVLIGLPAKQRMQRLYGTLSKKERPLEATLTTPKLTGVQYPVAWGLVYYLYHHQLDDGTHPYRRVLQDAIRYARGNKVDGMTLFLVTCLPTIGLDFEEFETQWIQAMIELAELEANPVAAADHHRARASHFLELGNLVAAAEGFHDTLLRAPNDVESLIGLAKITAGSEERPDQDNTLLWSRRAHRAAEEASSDGGVAQALALAKDSDSAGFKRLLKVEARYRRKVQSLVDLRISEGRPRTALAISRRYLDNVLGEDHFTPLSRHLRDEGLWDLRRTMRIFDGESLFGLTASPTSFQVEGGSLRANPIRPARAPVGISEPVGSRMRFEGEMHLGDCNSIVSFLLTPSNAPSNLGFAVRPKRVKGCKNPESMFLPFDKLRAGRVANLEEGYLEEHNFFDLVLKKQRKNPSPPPVGKWVGFALDSTEPGVLILEIDGKEAARQTIPLNAGTVTPSLLLYGGAIQLRALRVVELDRP